MDIDLNKFSALQKMSKSSFLEQKKILKNITSGKTVLCDNCKQPLKLYTPAQEDVTGIRCNKGCTDIVLDFV